MPPLSRKAVLLVGFIIGLVIWLIPMLLFGQPEAWVGNRPWYLLSLAASGLVLGFLGPGRPASAAIGVFLGQLVVLLWRVFARPDGTELWFVGVVLLAGYTSVATGIGALLGAAARRRLGPEAGPDRRVSDRRQ